MFCLDTDVWDRLLRSDKKAKEEQKITYRLVTQSVAPWAAESASPGSFLEMQNPGPPPDPLNQHLHFNRMPVVYSCI